MSVVASLLEAQTTALLRRLAREEETRTRRLRDEAEAQARDILRRARTEARTRVHQAVAESRREDETAIARRRAAIDTRARRSRQQTLRQLLDAAWEQLPVALAARWQVGAARDDWVRAACRQALRSLLHLDQVQVEADPAVLHAIEPVARAGLPGVARIEFVGVAGLGAGLRIRSADACLDATVPGLLAARDRVAAELLAEFERQLTSDPGASV
ncbi:MAG TPA: hypothetical protein VF851_04330 [Steroidobacteraceae bacterium]